jgi:hypothetical protein
LEAVGSGEIILLDLVVLETLRLYLGRQYKLAEINGPSPTPETTGLVITQAYGQEVNARPLITVRQGKSKNVSAPWVGYVADPSLAPITYRHESVIVDLETSETGGPLALHELLETIFTSLTSAVPAWTYPPPLGLGIYFPTWSSGEDELDSLDRVGGHLIYRNYVEISGQYEVIGEPPGLYETVGIQLTPIIDGTAVISESIPGG